MISENTELLKYFSIAREASDLHTNIFFQYLLWDYLVNNDLDRHIEKFRELYREAGQGDDKGYGNVFSDRGDLYQTPGRAKNRRSVERDRTIVKSSADRAGDFCT